MAESPTGVGEKDGAGGGQLGLFGEKEAPAARRPSTRDAESTERLAREHERAAAIARRLPPNIFFGTSSWSYPEWEGLVYSGRRTPSQLSREGLSEYSRHPLLTTVGVDRSFYAPIPRADLELYAGQLPAGFPCCLKAPQAMTSAALEHAGGQASRRANPDYLEPARFLDEIVAPVQEAFEDHAGPVILQFPPAPAALRLAPAAFAGRLERLLSALPKTLSYAVELREPALLTEDYRAALASHGVAHVYNYSGTMPMPAEQAKIVPIETAPFVVVRLLMPPGNRYEERRDALAPFNRLSAPDDGMRREVAALARAALATHRPVSILVNNKAEGCSPLTIRALAEMLGESKV